MLLSLLHISQIVRGGGRADAHENNSTKQRGGDKEQEEWGHDWDEGPQWDILYSIHYVSIYIGDVFDPSLVSLLKKTLPLLSLYSFLAQISQF